MRCFRCLRRRHRQRLAVCIYYVVVCNRREGKNVVYAIPNCSRNVNQTRPTVCDGVMAKRMMMGIVSIYIYIVLDLYYTFQFLDFTNVITFFNIVLTQPKNNYFSICIIRHAVNEFLFINTRVCDHWPAQECHGL